MEGKLEHIFTHTHREMNMSVYIYICGGQLLDSYFHVLSDQDY